MQSSDKSASKIVIFGPLFSLPAPSGKIIEAKNKIYLGFYAKKPFSRKAKVHYTYLKAEGMRNVRLSLMCLLAGMMFLGFLTPTDGAVKNGRVYYEGKDYGPFQGDAPYQEAFGDFILKQDILKTYPPNTATHINFFGRCYCWQKGAQEVKRLKVADFLQQVSPVCKPRTQLESSDLLMLAYSMGEIANETLCPNGHPNPITQEPQNPPPLQPTPK